MAMMDEEAWRRYIKLLQPGFLTKLSNEYMKHQQFPGSILDSLYQQQMMGKLNKMQQEYKPKEPKSRECWMVQCLFEEVMKHPHKFSEMDTGYIKDLNTKFFNDPNYLLSEKQIKWLDIIWEK